MVYINSIYIFFYIWQPIQLLTFLDEILFPVCFEKDSSHVSLQLWYIRQVTNNKEAHINSICENWKLAFHEFEGHDHSVLSFECH